MVCFQGRRYSFSLIIWTDFRMVNNLFFFRYLMHSCRWLQITGPWADTEETLLTQTANQNMWLLGWYQTEKKKENYHLDLFPSFCKVHEGLSVYLSKKHENNDTRGLWQSMVWLASVNQVILEVSNFMILFIAGSGILIISQNWSRLLVIIICMLK